MNDRRAASASLAEEFEAEMQDGLAQLSLAHMALSQSTLWSYKDPDHPELDAYKMSIVSSGRALGGWTRTEWQTRVVGTESELWAGLTQNWIVANDTRWEAHYRKALKHQLGKAPMVIVFGDLRKMRNDIVHHCGIATRRETGRCEVLSWFQEEERIRLDPEKCGRILDLVATWVREMGGTPGRVHAERRPANHQSPPGL